jgi:hypothetical protein
MHFLKRFHFEGVHFSSTARVQPRRDSNLGIVFEDLRLFNFNSEDVRLDESGRLLKDNPDLEEKTFPLW